MKHFCFGQSDFADTIPLEWTARNAYLIVEVNGRRMRFMIDTGSSMSVIYQQAIASRGEDFKRSLTTTGHITMHDALGANTKVSIVEGESFRIGHTEVCHYPLTVMRRAPGTAMCDGILGFDIINHGLTVKIDTRNHMLVITDNSKMLAREQKAGHTLRYTLQRHIPYVTLQPFEAMHEEMAFDTGCSFMCLINKEHLNRYESMRPEEVEGQIAERDKELVLIGSLSNDTAQTTTIIQLKALKWKRHEMRGIETQTTEGRSRVGSRLLEQGAVIINGRSRQITLCPYL